MNGLSIENLGNALSVDPAGGKMSDAAVRKIGLENGLSNLTSRESGSGPASGAASGFSKMLTDSIDKVNAMQVESDTAIKELVAGRSKNIHETMLTIERADTSLKLMMQVRNKLLDAYREIMRMQI